MRYKYETQDGSTYKLLKDNAQSNRSNATLAERIMWNELRGNKLGVHFRRQHPIGDYIADFICLKHQFVIEIDGGYHTTIEQQQSDEERDAYLLSLGFMTYRFSNEEVMQNLDQTILRIKEIINKCPK